MQKLEVYQSLWAMELRHPDNSEFTPEQNFSRAAQAGFAGLCLDPAIDEIDAIGFDGTRLIIGGNNSSGNGLYGLPLRGIQYRRCIALHCRKGKWPLEV